MQKSVDKLTKILYNYIVNKKGNDSMLKIEFTSKPFYSSVGGFLNDPTEKNLSMTFDDDCSSVEILAEIVKLLQFMGYSINSKKNLLDAVDEIVADNSLIKDDTDENQGL
jgi:hypothetical protein